MIKLKQEENIMITTLPTSLSYLDEKRTMKIQMNELIFEKMMKDKSFETLSIRTWTHIPRSKHLIKEYKSYKKTKSSLVANG